MTIFSELLHAIPTIILSYIKLCPQKCMLCNRVDFILQIRNNTYTKRVNDKVLIGCMQKFIDSSRIELGKLRERQ